jgi:hypothetical protein
LYLSVHQRSGYERIVGLTPSSNTRSALVWPEEHDPYPIGLSLSHEHTSLGFLQAYVCVHVIREYVKKHVENGVAVYAAMVTVVGLPHFNLSPSLALRIGHG